MSLLDLIQDNPLIIVSMGLGTAFLLAAALLLVVSLARTRLAAWQRQRALARAARLLAAAVSSAQAQEDDGLEDTVPTPPLAWSQIENTSEEITPMTHAEGQTETDEADNEVSEEVQDILSSVFADESEEARYAKLLRHQTIPSAGELVTLSQNIAARLGVPPSQTRQKTS